MGSRVEELIAQVRAYQEEHRCTHESCTHEREGARRMADATLTVFRSTTELDTEQLVETLHGVVMWLEAFLEYNIAVSDIGDEEKISLADAQNAAKAALFVIGEDLIAMQDMNIIP